MAYHVSILRTRQKGPWPITRSEVEALSASDFAIQIDRSNLGDRDLLYILDGKVILSLTLQDGELWTAGFDRQQMLLIIKIANLLNARVRDDEYVTYTTPDETFFHPDDNEDIEKASNSEAELIRKVRWNQLIMNISIISFFIILGLLAAHFSK